MKVLTLKVAYPSFRVVIPMMSEKLLCIGELSESELITAVVIDNDQSF